MIDKNKPAYPFVPNQQQTLPDGTWDQNCEFGDPGITIRQYYAAKAMQTIGVNLQFSYKNIAEQSFKMADAMIEFENKMKWETTIKLKDLLTEYDVNSDDELEEVARVKPLWIERLSQYPALRSFAPSLEKIKTKAGFNKWLDRLYDFCDYERIWVE
jgi:hypothetical protein